MRKEEIEKAYKVGHQYTKDNIDSYELEDLIQIGVQMALNGEVIVDNDGKIIRID